MAATSLSTKLNAMMIQYNLKQQMRIVFVAIIPLCVMRLDCAAQTMKTTISAAKLESAANAFGFSGLPFYPSETLGWRFHGGDDVAWADPTFADSAWVSAVPSTITNDAMRSAEFARARIGWLRLHFRVDSALHKRSFAFVMALFGAAEVYVDGRLVGQYGFPSALIAGEVLPSISRFTLQTALLNVSANEPHVLAVRYSFAHYDDYISSPYQGGFISLPTGLRTAFMTWDAVEAYRRTALQTVIQFGAAVGMPLLAAILHLVLFLLHRKERANLFVSIFSFITALQACSFALSAHVMGQSLTAFALGGIGQTIALPGTGVSLWYVAQTLFATSTKLPKYHWWLLGSNVVVWLAVLLIGDTANRAQFIVQMTAVALAFIPLLLLLPVIISAVRKGLDGSRILGVGISLCVIAWTLEVVLSFMGTFYAARPLPIAVFIRFGIFIAIPLALAIVLARRTAELAIGLAKQNEHLEENVAKRTQALHNANTALQRQNQELAELSIEKEELVNIVSHDLKNPIGAIRGLAEIITSDDLTVQESSKIAGRIVQTADRMLELVKNLLDINRLESGGVQMNLVPFNIAPMIEAVVWQYGSPAAAKNITLHFKDEATNKASNEASGSLILADEQAIMQVLDNLISNAVKYSPQGKNVSVRLKSSVDAVYVEVQDQGPGISAEDQKRLFGKFARLSAQPTGGEHSTGLGLSIVKKLVEAMNGRVWCESELGKGATFIVELPQKGAS
jgi:signal transduction histidine kinase